MSEQQKIVIELEPWQYEYVQKALKNHHVHRERVRKGQYRRRDNLAQYYPKPIPVVIEDCVLSRPVQLDDL